VVLGCDSGERAADGAAGATPAAGAAAPAKPAGAATIPECDDAAKAIEQACATPGLSDTVQKACTTAKKSIVSLAGVGEKTGRTEVAVEACAKQAQNIERMVSRSAPRADAKPGDTPTAAEVGVDADADPADESQGGSCDALAKQVAAACDAGDLTPSQKQICDTNRKVAETFSKLASKNADAAQTGCKKIADDWAKKGGLEKMVADAK
jgi:hypothetical protein